MGWFRCGISDVYFDQKVRKGSVDDLVSGYFEHKGEVDA